MNDMLNNDNLYHTDDRALAAAIALHYPLEAVDRDTPYDDVRFTFQHTPQLDALVEQYQRGELRVEPQAYWHQLQLLHTTEYDVI